MVLWVLDGTRTLLVNIDYRYIFCYICLCLCQYYIYVFLQLFTGSGKTTFLHRLVAHSQSLGIKGYVLNLDPAVLSLPFTANIDIRDTVNYKNVMKEYNLGPNGAILTSLNLFATKFDEVSGITVY